MRFSDPFSRPKQNRATTYEWKIEDIAGFRNSKMSLHLKKVKKANGQTSTATSKQTKFRKWIDSLALKLSKIINT